MDKKTEFKPYVPADKITPELTVTSIIVGVLLAIIFGAANAYLGLQVGMTVSASIPAAVVAMGVIRVLMRRNSILESNVVQTIGSAGESLAAGTVFTLPALFIWASEGKTQNPDLIEISVIALIGGLLGVFFMIPLRNALIVKEHGTLPYPEGKACAEVLLAGEKGGSGAGVVFAGMGIAAVFKFITSGLMLVPESIALRVKDIFGAGAAKTYSGEVSAQVYPAVMSVGYICGPRISSYMFAGGVLSWLVLIPALAIFGGETVMYPGEVAINTMAAGDIWGSYVRYIGAGALAAAGIISLIKSMPLIVKTFSGAIKSMRGAGTASQVRTERDINMVFVLGAILALTVLIWLLPAIPVSFLGALIIVIFGFFFATVSSRMVGLVGSSNNPVSGMAIATLLIATLILKFTGATGIAGMTSAIAIGTVICIVAAIAGDTSQDLKTGYILGATPRKQQYGEIIGVVAAALVIGGTLFLLNEAWGFGPDSPLKAPQANLMKVIVEGVMGGNLPWGMVIIGVFIAVVAEVLGIPALAFAIGVYLPIEISACIMIGGLVRWMVDRVTRKNEKRKAEAGNRGTLYCSGMIAGEGICGLLIAILTVVGVAGKDKILDLSRFTSKFPWVYSLLGVVVILLIAASILFFSLRKKKAEK